MGKFKKKNKGGRPSIFNPEILQKLQAAFNIGCSDREACLYAGVKPSTFYDYCAKHPEFSEQKEQWKKNPVLRAKYFIYENLTKDLKTARWYLERKCKDEFSLRNDLPEDKKDDTKEAYLKALKNMNNAD